MNSMESVYEDARLRDRMAVFQDREDAGEKLAQFIQQRFTFSQALVCPIPAGGVPIGVALACALTAPLKLAIVRKIQVPWSTESGFGAVTWSGDVVINEDLLARLTLSPQEIETAISRARESVQDRIGKYAKGRPRYGISGSTVILTDDGLASGFTMRAAVDSVRRENPERVVVAVPTGSLEAVRMISARVDELICLNVRGGFSFAVADAYRYWHDLSDDEVRAYLDQAIQSGLY